MTTAFELNGDVLQLPSFQQWGSSDVTLNGNKIPAAKIWQLVAAFLAHGKKVPEKLLIEEAKKAEIYRLIGSGKIVWTLNPEEDDKQLSGNVYSRKSKERVRYLVDKFNLIMGKIDGNVNKESITEMCNYCATLGLHLIAYQEDKMYFSQDPEAFYEAMGSSDPIRLAVFCKRPSASFISVNLGAET